MLFTRDYVKEIIINVISVHAEITRLSPWDSPEIKTVMFNLVEAITEEINRIFTCIRYVPSIIILRKHLKRGGWGPEKYEFLLFLVFYYFQAFVKVRQSRKEILVSSILSKNKQKITILSIS